MSNSAKVRPRDSSNNRNNSNKNRSNNTSGCSLFRNSDPCHAGFLPRRKNAAGKQTLTLEREEQLKISYI